MAAIKVMTHSIFAFHNHSLWTRAGKEGRNLMCVAIWR